jgi:putative restriction endonuclease
VRGFVAPTDHGWYQFLRARPEIDKVNFWRPGGVSLSALEPGEVFFFKLKAPYNAIGGFGLFARFAPLSVWRAWDVFGQANGTADKYELLERLGRLAGGRRPMSFDRVIGCIAITQPVFFAPDDWITVPSDWSRNIVSGRRYDLTEGEGLRLWSDCLERAARSHHLTGWTTEAIELRRHGKPQIITPRLGQASFRLAVLDAYGGACAVTTEHSLPVLEATHIRPWKDGGRHELSNGLPLRRDIHRLFDLGFVTSGRTGASRSAPHCGTPTPTARRTTRSTDARSQRPSRPMHSRPESCSSGTATWSSAPESGTSRSRP